MPRPIVPAWLRRGLEAAVGAAVVAIAALLGNGLVGTPPPRELSGLLGATALAPPVLALAVIGTAYPVAMAATRGDAVLGAIAAFLVAGDLTLIVAAAPVTVPGVAGAWPAGFVAAVVAAVPAVLGVVGGQLLTPFGFGRRAGAFTAVLSGVAAATALAFYAGLG